MKSFEEKIEAINQLIKPKVIVIDEGYNYESMEPEYAINYDGDQGWMLSKAEIENRIDQIYRILTEKGL